MGTFTDNLLKLTEFPFSYSLISLIVLMYSGQGVFNLGSEETLAALLVLMGFVATTLSITDPIGFLQKVYLRGLDRQSSESIRYQELEEIKGQNIKEKEREDDEEEHGVDDEEHGVDEKQFKSLSVFRKREGKYLRSKAISATLAYKFLIRKHKDEKKKEFADYSRKEMNNMERGQLVHAALSLRDSTLRTTWIRREIDKTTAMIYFVIVIVTFLALFSHPDHEKKFIDALQGLNQAGTGDGSATTDDGDTVLSEQSQEAQQLPRDQPVQEEAATETRASQATNETIVIQHLQAAKAELEANDIEASIAAIDAALEELNQPEDGGGGLSIRDTIIIFSILALIAVSYMIYRRLKHLTQYTRTTFQYLMTELAYRTARRAVKIKDESFKEDLQEVKRYLDDGDWTLARFSVHQIIHDYRILFIDCLKIAD